MRTAMEACARLIEHKIAGRIDNERWESIEGQIRRVLQGDSKISEGHVIQNAAWFDYIEATELTRKNSQELRERFKAERERTSMIFRRVEKSIADGHKKATTLEEDVFDAMQRLMES